MIEGVIAMTSKMRNCLFAVTALAACATAALGADSTTHLSVTARYAIGGTDIGYDYLRLERASGRLFVAHGGRVEVLDSHTGKSVGQIENTPGVHGIALATVAGHGFTSNGTERSVTMFDLASLKTLTVI